MSDYQEAREKIAKRWVQAVRRDDLDDTFPEWEYLSEHGRESARKAADDILHLTYPDGSPMIGVIAKDQTLPETIHNPFLGDLTVMGTNDMAANFRRIAKEE